ncbi:MAG: hypothetical protein HY881_09950 [Deltaproteobacteria bacterium]|nr:hypothetical protein [Deltaproteobacteria bacterium]
MLYNNLLVGTRKQPRAPQQHVGRRAWFVPPTEAIGVEDWMQALRYVQKLHETLSEVSEGGGNQSLFVVMDHDLVARSRVHAYKCIEERAKNAVHTDSHDFRQMFVADLMSRNIFNSRIRYCVAKLQEFAIPSSQQYDFISDAIALYVGGDCVDRYGQTMSVRDALVAEVAMCFAPWYRPDDIFMLDFAEEHCLCSRKLRERLWDITALGRYVLKLPSFETIITILAAEVVLSRRHQYRFVSRQILEDLRSGRGSSRGIPYSLRMFDLVSDDRESVLDERGHPISHVALSPLGEKVVESVLQSEDRLQDLILVMLESEVENVDTSILGFDKTSTQADIVSASLLESDDKESVRRSASFAQKGAYVDALRMLFPLTERLVDATIRRLGYANPGSGMAKKVGLLVAKGILSHDTASFAEIVTARNKVAHGSIGRNDHVLLKPLYALTFNYLARLVQEVESNAINLEAKSG